MSSYKCANKSTECAVVNSNCNVQLWTAIINVISLDEIGGKSEEITGHSDPNVPQCYVIVKLYVLLNLELMLFTAVP